MRRRSSWIQLMLLAACAMLAIAYTALAIAVPPWARRRLYEVMGDRVSVGRIRLGFPFRLVLSDVRMQVGQPEISLSSRRIVIGPMWYVWPQRLVWVQAIDVQGVRCAIRHTPSGAFVWSGAKAPPARVLPAHPVVGQPSIAAPPAVGSPSIPDAFSPAGSAPPSPSAPWPSLFINTVGISDGVIELADEKLATPFRGSLSEIALAGGPVAVPSSSGQISVAVQARLVGHLGQSAAVYCSGWVNLPHRDLDVSCQLEPLPLAAFAPYYEQGLPRLRVSEATLQAQVHLAAKANIVDGRIQLEIANLGDAELGAFGRKLADVKEMANDQRRLTGQIHFSGPLDQPGSWQMELAPGNQIVERLVNPLLNRGIDEIQIHVGQQTIAVGLTSGGAAVTSTIEQTAKTVQESLELLAPQPAERAVPGAIESRSPSATPEAPSPAPESSPVGGPQGAVADPSGIE